jgi:hypothetical protein
MNAFSQKKSADFASLPIAALGEIGFSNQGMHILLIPDHVADLFYGRGQQRVVCTLMGKVVLHAALIKHGDLGFAVYVNKRVLQTLGLVMGQKVPFSMDEDTNPDQFPMPEELAVALDQDEEAKKAFESLTAGARRGFMHWVGQVKSIDKKIERALKVVSQVKMGVTAVHKMQRIKDI